MGSHWVNKMDQNCKKLPCSKIRIFDYPAVFDFLRKMEVMVMAPNHGGDPLGSILGPMGFHWDQKMRQNRKKLPCPKIQIFNNPAVMDFLQKKRINGYGAKSRLAPSRVHLGANRVPLGPKNGSKPEKITMPPNSNFWLPRGHQFFAKNGSYSYGAKSRWGPSRVHLGSNGVPLGQKNGSSRKKFPCLYIGIFDFPPVINFSQKMEVLVMAPTHGGPKNGSKP